MMRILVFAAAVLALGVGFSWLADRPGELSILWQGQLIEMSLMVAASLIVALIAAVMILWWLVRLIWTSPHSVTRFFRARKRDRGYQALSTGLIAAGSGNALLAAKMAARARGLISADQEPLIHLLEAQTALIEGRHEAARKKFELMADDPETRELGLRGLYLEAKRLGAPEAARQYAEQAAEKAPYLPWAAQATLEYRGQAGHWDDAIRLLEQSRAARVIERKQADRLKAVLLTARAGDRLDGDPKTSRDDAQQALKLAPELVPAALIAAKAYFRENNVRKASSILEQSWKADPHPDIGQAYVRARSGDSTLDRLKRAERLEALKPNNIEALLIVARAALDAQEFPKARLKAEAAARIGSREGAYLLLADIEEAETGDQGRVRHWLGQALRAPRDPAWVADGVVSDKWLAVSPVTGRLDAFEWKAPFGQLDGPTEEGSAASAADEALRTLPPIRDVTPAPANAAVIDATPPAATGAVTDETVAEKPEPQKRKPEAEPRKVKSGAEGPLEPFFGRPPDDPGVRTANTEPEARTRLNLF